MRFRPYPLLAFLCLCIVSVARAQAGRLESAFVFKNDLYHQGSDGVPRYGESSIAAGFLFTVPQVAIPYSGVLVQSPNWPLAINRLSEDGLSVGSYAERFDSRARMNSLYPNGTMRLIHAEPFAFDSAIALAGDRYPSGARVSNLSALQAIPGRSATIEWQPLADTQPGDVVTVAVSDFAGNTLFSAPVIANRATVEVPPGRESLGSITVSRTTAATETAGVAVRAGYSTVTTFTVRSTGESDVIAPRVVSTQPATDEVDVSPTSTVRLTFDEPMRPVGLLSGPQSPAGTRQRVRWSEDQRTAFIDFPAEFPAGPVELTFGTERRGPRQFADLSGNSPKEDSVAARFFVGNLPFFTRNPQTSNITPGSRVTLSAAAVWPPGGLTYQWFLDGLPVPGATETTLTISGMSLAQTGLYELRATNAHGATVSAPALVMLNQQSTSLRASIQPSHEAHYSREGQPMTPGLPLTLEVRLESGMNSTVYWRKNGERIPGATTATLEFARLTESDSGVYDAVLTNEYATAATEPFTLFVAKGRPLPTYEVMRGSLVYARGESGFLQFFAGDPYGYLRGWEINGKWEHLPGSVVGATQFPDLQPQDAGVYRYYVSNGIDRVLVAEYTVRVLDVPKGAPVIAQQPQDIWFDEVYGRDTRPEVKGDLPLSYQWKKDGVPLPGFTNSFLRAGEGLPGVAGPGRYTCVVTNSKGSAETDPITVRFWSARTAPEKPRINGASERVVAYGWSFHLVSKNDFSPAATTRIRWYRDGVEIPGAAGESPNLDLYSMAPHNSGAYTVVYSNTFGSAESDPVRVLVDGLESPPRVVAEKKTIRVKAGRPFDLIAPFSLAGSLQLRWFQDGREVTAEYTPAAAGKLSIANAQPRHAGTWSVEATNAAGSTLVSVADVVLEPSPPVSARLANVSTRAIAGQGSETLIVGFAINGTVPKRMLLRAIGPTLGKFGIQNPVKNPRLAVFRGAQMIASNDEWYRQTGVASLVTAQRNAGAYELELPSADAALVGTFEPGAYTIQYMVDEPGDRAIGLIEVYDGDPGYPPSRVTNLSSRLFVGTGEQAAIPGLVIRGSETRTYLIRAAGPGLGKFGVSGVLADPRISVSDGKGMVFTNDDWSSGSGRTALVQAAERVGAFALDTGSKDAALLVALPAGNYTALVSGAGDSTGVALVELYEVP